MLETINNSLISHKQDINQRFNNLDDKLIKVITENSALSNTIYFLKSKIVHLERIQNENTLETVENIGHELSHKLTSMTIMIP